MIWNLDLLEIPHRLSFWNAKDRERLEQATHATGYDIRVIDAPEYPLTIDEGPHIAVWTYDERHNLHPFWDEYRRLAQEHADGNGGES